MDILGGSKLKRQLPVVVVVVLAVILEALLLLVGGIRGGGGGGGIDEDRTISELHALYGNFCREAKGYQ